MKRIFLLLGCGMLAAGMALAQDTGSSNSASSSQDQSTQTRTQSNTTQDNTVRGCLSGSAGNYTITDANGTQYQVTGNDATLKSSVGQEVEIRVTQKQSSDTSNQGATTTRTTHTVQASQVTALNSACDTGNPSGSASPNSMGTTPDNSTAPKGTPQTTEPATPRMMSMLQQQSMPGAEAQSQNSTTPQTQATPPVTSQTPATQSSPNQSATPQAGTSPANNTGMTESEANHDAQAARQGEMNTNPQTGDTTGRGVNNQGVNNPSTTNPGAVPTSPNSATPSSAQPQSNANDQNKPVYGRQATDIPWATHSGTDAGNTGTPAPPQ